MCTKRIFLVAKKKKKKKGIFSSKILNLKKKINKNLVFYNKSSEYRQLGYNM